MSKGTVLVADDEGHIRELVQIYLTRAGYSVVQASNGPEALQLWHKQTPALVILDIMMPGIDGWEVLRQIRKERATPVIMLTAKDSEMDKVYGLELGADDYVTKPFSPGELVSRVKAVLRRADKPMAQTVSYPGFSVNRESREITVDGTTMTLPPKEFDLLWLLASNPNKVFTREHLLEKVWGYAHFADIRTVDVHIRRLRLKVEKNPDHPNYLKTVWGVGYKLEYNPGLPRK